MHKKDDEVISLDWHGLSRRKIPPAAPRDLGRRPDRPATTRPEMRPGRRLLPPAAAARRQEIPFQPASSRRTAADSSDAAFPLLPIAAAPSTSEPIPGRAARRENGGPA